MSKDLFTYHELTIISPNGTSNTFNSTGNAGRTASNTTSFAGFSAVSVEMSRTLDANTTNITIPQQSDFFQTLVSTLTSSVALDGFSVRYSIVLDDVRKPLLVGKLNTVELDEQTIKLGIVDYASRLSHGIVYRIGRSCRNTFGDAACGYNLASVTFSFVIGNIAPDRLSFTVTAPMVNNEYVDGFVNWTGTNLKSDIAFNNTNTLYLFDEVPRTIQVGNTINLTRGCNRSFQNCQTFNNTINFGGIPDSQNYLIGSTRAIAATKNLRD